MLLSKSARSSSKAQRWCHRLRPLGLPIYSAQSDLAPFIKPKNLVNEKRARFLKHLVEFRRRHFSNGVENDVLFDSEKSLLPNEAWPPDFAAFTIGTIQWNGESVPVRAACDLAQN
jgi:hypothetical protein